jgi:hypothetical protein
MNDREWKIKFIKENSFYDPYGHHLIEMLDTSTNEELDTIVKRLTRMQRQDNEQNKRW